MKIILIGLILTLFLSGCITIVQKIPEEYYCETDAGCVESSCCHAVSCLNAKFKPDCEGIMCTMECRPGTLDCGQGKCICEDNMCVAELN